MKLTLENLNEVIDEEINPSLAAHSGFVTIAALEEKRIILSFNAACAGCPSSTGATLNQIQAYLIEHFNDKEILVENAEFAE